MVWTPTAHYKVKSGFAIIPLTLANGDKIWLQRYYYYKWLSPGLDIVTKRFVTKRVAETKAYLDEVLDA